MLSILLYLIVDSRAVMHPKTREAKLWNSLTTDSVNRTQSNAIIVHTIFDCFVLVV